MKYLLIIILAILIYACKPILTESGPDNFHSSQNSHINSDGKPTGQGCYAKCLIPNEYSDIRMPILYYTGDDYNDPNVKSVSIQLEEASSEWVKKRADKNCLSSNPEDCLVWCLVEKPAEFFEYFTVIDTNSNKQFAIQKIADIDDLPAGGFTQWRKVVCENDITPQLYFDIQNELYDRGYLTNEEVIEEDLSLTKGIKNGLINFQMDNRLPIGQIDYESLAALGVDPH